MPQVNGAALVRSLDRVIGAQSKVNQAAQEAAAQAVAERAAAAQLETSPAGGPAVPAPAGSGGQPPAVQGD